MKNLSTSEGALMIFVALLCDFFQAMVSLVPFVGFILGLIANVVILTLFWIWFLPHGGLFGKNLFGSLTTLGIEAVPFLNTVPVWTLRVTILVRRRWRAQG